MIISLEKARNILKGKDDEEIKEELYAVEVMIRNSTNNNFQDTRVRVDEVLEAKGNSLIGANFKAMLFRVGDRVEVDKSILNEGLYDVIAVDDNSITLDRDLEEIKTQTMVTKVKYPEDIGKGIGELLAYSEKMKDKLGVKSETVSRYSVEYFDMGKNENIEGYPHSLMNFIKKYKKLRWS